MVRYLIPTPPIFNTFYYQQRYINKNINGKTTRKTGNTGDGTRAHH